MLVSTFFLLYSPFNEVGIDEQGAFVKGKGQLQRVVFIRADSMQLIARVTTNATFLQRLYPRYVLIFRDSLSKEEYAILRSFASQQILLSRSKR